MNDPHVQALHYKVTHDERVEYKNAETLTCDAPEFTVVVENGTATFVMKNHFPTIEEARETVEPAIRSWELACSLENRPDEFGLAFTDAEIVDLRPTPGVIHVQSTSAMFIGGVPSIRIGKSKYPEPVFHLVVDKDVEAMSSRFSQYLREKETLAGVAYFCFTVLRDNAGSADNARKKFNVSRDVLHTLGKLASTKGGQEARKSTGRAHSYADAERQWLDKVLRAIIRRAAEVAATPNKAMPQIVMANFPSL